MRDPEMDDPEDNLCDQCGEPLGVDYISDDDDMTQFCTSDCAEIWWSEETHRLDDADNS